MKNWTEFLRTSNGSVEINRLVGFLGGIAYIIGALGVNVSELCTVKDGSVTLKLA